MRDLQNCSLNCEGAFLFSKWGVDHESLNQMTTSEAADFTAVLQKYDQFINDKLKPDLKATLDSRDSLYDVTSE
jgi:hypothetical protein